MKSHNYLLKRGLGGPQNPFKHFGKEKNFCPLPEL
jgi:hypothetical protein